MNKIFDYTNLTLNELIEKISIARFFHLPKMVAEALRKIPSGGGSEPAYKVYTALLTQTGTDAPVATVLENTLGYDIVWSRLNAGGYTATATEFAIEDFNKFYCNIGNKPPSGASTDISSYIVEASTLPLGSPSSFEVYTKTILNSTGVVTRGDNILEFTPIEIRVYN